MQNQIIILAAGKGSRMESDLPKVMHEVAGKSMIERVVENCSKVTSDLVLVYSDHLLPYLHLFKQCKLAKQEQQLGTAHAVSVATSLIDSSKLTAVIYGDNPLITASIINGLFQHLEDSSSAVVTLALECNVPNQYGRIILNDEGEFKKIVEFKFASEKERSLTLCNSGIMAFAPGILSKYLPKCLISDPKLPERELYLTDIIAVCSEAGEKVSYHTSEDHALLVGVNTKAELEKVNNLVRESQG